MPTLFTTRHVPPARPTEFSNRSLGKGLQGSGKPSHRRSRAACGWINPLTAALSTSLTLDSHLHEDGVFQAGVENSILRQVMEKLEILQLDVQEMKNNNVKVLDQLQVIYKLTPVLHSGQCERLAR